MALLILLAVGWPLYRMLETDAPARTPAWTAATPEPKKPVHLQVSFTSPPTRLRVLALGQEVWKAEAPGLDIEHDLSVAFPKEGVDLQFEAEWPAEIHAAARVRLTDPEGADHEKFLWGTGPTTDVLTFP